jgi:peptidoglycan/LPS O-acetylase OafA/YrhL
MSAANAIPKNTIPAGMSLYLDLIRFFAAVMVMASHTWHHFSFGLSINFPGHEAVVVFFVLSGYVIAHASSRPGITLSVYAQHRMARILPVAWLALLLAGVLTALLPALGQESGSLTATLANLIFMGQSGWGWKEAPLNSPYWSLNYEVWYYIIFAIWTFVRNRRLLWLAAALLLAGPKILMLMPVWMMGVVLYRRSPVLNRPASVILFIATLGIAWSLHYMDLSEVWRAWLYRAVPPFWRAHYSSQFIYDLVLGVVVTANFAAVASLSPMLEKLHVLEKPIRYLASFTLSLYVFHAPLTELLVRIVKVESPWLFYGILAACIFMLAELTERRTGWYRRQLAKHHSLSPSLTSAS